MKSVGEEGTTHDGSWTLSEREVSDVLRTPRALGHLHELGPHPEGAYRRGADARAMRRMTAYLRQAGPRGPEEIADEMLAIVTDRDRWAEQKRSEYYNAKVTEFYNRPRNANDE